MENKEYIILQNHSTAINLDSIPVHDYNSFKTLLLEILKNSSNHCIQYFAFPQPDTLKFICCIAFDETHEIGVFSHETPLKNKSLKSLCIDAPQLHVFEREIFENYKIDFVGHPWLKPVRFPHGAGVKMDDYPFYSIESDELHEVGVGPVHAGIIEPGHFRFICNGEKVLHLEIHLGYQHRGIEQLMLSKETPLQKMILSESISGDTTIGHSWAHAALMESLCGISISKKLLLERMIALELERIAIHIGDTAALCTDVAYQFGQVVNEALRTTIINTTQLWCGNRFGKGLIRVGGSHYPITPSFYESMMAVLDDTGKRYIAMADRIYSLPTVLARFDGIGIVTKNQAYGIGAVGMAARMTGIVRDVRQSHPFAYYADIDFVPETENSGDVLARGMLRNKEVRASLKMIKQLVNMHQKEHDTISEPKNTQELKPNSFSIAMIEGWRGEIVHCGITNEFGKLIQYKIKDPSLHNWFALALAVRNQEISDFPINNKSFNLSYCGNDL